VSFSALAISFLIFAGLCGLENGKDTREIDPVTCKLNDCEESANEVEM
jgi:hypothetical protein